MGTEASFGSPDSGPATRATGVADLVLVRGDRLEIDERVRSRPPVFV
jgi:hypothetical protein